MLLCSYVVKKRMEEITLTISIIENSADILSPMVLHLPF